MKEDDNAPKVIPIECPVCGSHLNKARAFDGTDDNPKPNDVSVCVYCTTVLVFDDSIKPRVITDQEFELVKTSAPDLYKELNDVIRVIQKNRGKPSDIFNS